MKPNDPNVMQVVRVEHHLWKTCHCRECTEERARRAIPREPTDSHLCRISPDAAYLLGIIKKRCPEGSLARQLALAESPSLEKGECADSLP